MFLLLAGGTLYSQEGEQDQQQQIQQKLKKSGISQTQFQEMLSDLEKYNPEDIKKIQSGELSPQESEALLKKALSNMPKEVVQKYTGVGKGGMLNEKAEKAVTAGLETFRSMPYDKAYGHIKTKVDASKAAFILKKIPKSYAFITNFLRDEVAPKKFFGIIKDRKRLVTFGALSFGVIFIGWLVKRKRKKKQMALGEAFFKGFTHFIFFTGLKVVLIFYFFGAEIKPIVRVFKETYS